MSGMSTTSAALTVAGILAVSLTGTYVELRRRAGIEPDRDRIVREAHERAEAARVLDEIAMGRATPGDLDAGLQRLRQAVHDTTTEGDQL